MTEILISSVISSVVLGFLVLTALHEKGEKCRLSSLKVFQSLTAALLFFAVVFTVGLYLSDNQEKNKRHVHSDFPEWISDGDYENVDDGDFYSFDPAGFSVDDSNNE